MYERSEFGTCSICARGVSVVVAKRTVGQGPSNIIYINTNIQYVLYEGSKAKRRLFTRKFGLLPVKIFEFGTIDS